MGPAARAQRHPPGVPAGRPAGTGVLGAAATTSTGRSTAGGSPSPPSTGPAPACPPRCSPRSRSTPSATPAGPSGGASGGAGRAGLGHPVLSASAAAARGDAAAVGGHRHRSARAVDAGSPRVLRLRGGQVARIALEQQLPLGMFAETRYDVQEFDRAARRPALRGQRRRVRRATRGQEAYGERAMARSMRSTRLQPATEAVGTVMRELFAYHADTDLRDDAVVVCLDWCGPGGRCER